MMQYFEHIEYADKIFLFLLLFDVVYHISNKQTAKRGQAKSVLKKILKKIDKIFCSFKNYIYLCCVETNQQTAAPLIEALKPTAVKVKPFLKHEKFKRNFFKVRGG